MNLRFLYQHSVILFRERKGVQGNFVVPFQDRESEGERWVFIFSFLEKATERAFYLLFLCAREKVFHFLLFREREFYLLV